MITPTISIDRASRSFAIFDCAGIPTEFAPYTDEAAALAAARARVAAVTSAEPRIAYPQITSMRMYTGTRRARR